MRLRTFTSIITIGVAIAAIGATAGCHREAAADVDAAHAKTAPIPVEVATARDQDLERNAEIQGALFAKERATIAAQVEGVVAEVNSDFGDSVKQGQVIVKIDPREYQLKVQSMRAALEQVNARLTNSQARFHRATELKDAGTISAEQFDQTASSMRVDQADVDSAAKALALAQKKLGDTEIRAPFAGSIQRRIVSLGEYVQPGKQLFELIATDPIKLRTAVPERYVPLAHVGLGVKLTIDARPGAVFTGVVTRVAPALDDQSRTLLAEAEIQNPDGVLKPGYFAHVTVDLGHDHALFIPQGAVLRYAGIARVFVVSGGVATSREVKTGETIDGRTEIISGLKAGEQVAVSNIDRLSDGSAVAAKEQRS